MNTEEEMLKKRKEKGKNRKDKLNERCKMWIAQYLN